MLESICIKSGSKTNPIDFGFLCEAILYYGKVKLIINHKQLSFIFRRASIRGIEKLIKENRLEIYLSERHLSSMAFDLDSKNRRYAFEIVKGVNDNHIKEIYKSFEKITNSIPKSIRLTDEFSELIKPFDYSETVTDSLKDDLSDREFVINTLNTYIKDQYPDVIVSPYDINVNFFVDSTKVIENRFGYDNEAFGVESNLPLDKFSESSSKRGYHSSDFFSGYLLSLLEATGDIEIASNYSSEIATKQLYSNIIKLKIESLYNRNSQSTQNIQSFNEHVLEDCYSISEAIRSHKLHFSEFLKILNKADKFRSWLSGKKDDADLVIEYYKAISVESKFDRFPLKHMKFA